MKWCKLTVMFILALVTNASLVSGATVHFLYGNNPLAGSENVLFNQPSLTHTGTTVQGITNQTHLIVNFTSTTELTTPSSGQARIVGNNGNLFNDLEVELEAPQGAFAGIVFNINATANGVVTFTVDPFGGGPAIVQQMNLSGSGSNFFTIYAAPGLLRTLRLDTTVSVSAIEDLKQIRIQGAQVVPLPLAAWGGLALLSSIGGIGYFRRRRVRFA